MTVNRTTLLDLPLPVTGTESGTWGDTTNNGLTQYVDIAIAGMSNLTSANFTAGALTIETTEGDSSATNISATSAQYAGFRVTSLAANSTITVGNTGTSPARSYRLINADATYSLTFKATGQTGVTLLPGQSALVAFNGTDYVIVGTVGAGSTTDNTVPRFDGTTGKILQSSGITIDDSNNVSGVAQLNITTLDATNIEVTNIKAKDGTAAASIADSTGVISVTANPVLSGGTANGVLYLNGSKVATSGSALTFDGTTFSLVASSASQAGSIYSRNTNGGAGAYSGLTIGNDVSANKGGVLLASSAASASGFIGPNSTYFYNTDGLIAINAQSNNPILFGVNNAEQMRLTSTGLGIGTSSPAAKLHTSTTTAGNSVGALLANPNQSGSADSVSINFGLGRTADSFLFSIPAISFVKEQQWTSTGSTVDGALTFSTILNETVSEKMRLDSSGNLGIGTSSPATKLHLYRGAAATTLTIDSGTSGTAISYNLAGVSKYTAEYVSASDFYSIGRSGVAYDLILKSGNLGLGVTPSAWYTGAGFKIFQIGSTGALQGGFTNLRLLQNAYYNSSGAPTYLANGYATEYLQDSGQHIWKTAASGTAGNAITFTQAMTLDASGFLSVGTTTARAQITAQSDLGVQNGLSVLNTGSTYGQGYQLIRFMNSAASYAGSISHTASTGIGLYSAGDLLLGANSTERARITSGGDVVVTGVGGLGYGTGSGGAVTQATSRTTGVTLDKTNGAITLVSAAGTTTWQTFTVTNNKVVATDTVIVNQKSGTDLYQIFVTNVAAGSFKISFATTGGTTTEQPVFNFAVIKAVTA